ncbi:adenylate kinase isoenzyme 6 isoform X2 [Oratosquilla oratoria]|uniref:adenylate kinase isoenzyme 6 isoform X2 n=1 Tax=Oratosquilla oratoria TaxID=337810 RepID=UPI003F767A1B
MSQLVLSSGTPGVGKTTLAQLIAERTNMEAISVGDLAKANNFFCGFDEELQCPILDEDKVLDELEDMIAEGGKIVDYHGSEFFPERFFDIVFVLRTDNTLLYDRLASRGYAGKKLEDNVECEIMNVLRDEALENYAADIVHELPSNTPDDMENNLQRILAWIESWIRDNNIVTS